MGISLLPPMDFNLRDLFPNPENLDCLVDQFYTQEKDNLIKVILSDKAPGPDGFNGFFLKKCWQIISQDFYRGVRQGDPLSPLLFVLGAELLQRIVNKACSLGLLTKSINELDERGFPIIQYADDTSILLKALQREVFCFKALLNSFAHSTGLKVNYHKSCLYPINLSHENAVLFAGLLGCTIGTMPFTYLGLPMGTTRPRVVDFC
uniref:Retrotransposon protein, putative, unclassified n=2 Tax=Oryza sativa subsp. japonica TaxID=39947 RepID=Q94LN7_ORYSJ|nr:Putative non-LTR retroelement reverse transcriptase [Oryza sativa Japonica Group]AAP51866.1 retrotransposon protein, putative, unclassified [Oryza sativa Japonica Group]